MSSAPSPTRIKSSPPISAKASPRNKLSKSRDSKRLSQKGLLAMSPGSPRGSPRGSNTPSPRSPFASPRASPRSKNNRGSPMNSPRKAFSNLLAKVRSPIIRRRKRTDSFVAGVERSTLGDYTVYKELASGFIGRVYLTKHNETGEFFALKTMSQEGVIAHRQLERVFNEKKIHQLLSVNNAYQVVKLYKAFKDHENIYLLMEYEPADLFTLLNQMHHHVMTNDESKFLAAITILSLDAMHRLGVVYRDLKPQNILIDDVGYPMITDFGFSKMLNLRAQKKSLPGLPPQTMSFVGTPAYMAPELIKRKYYAEAVDWWALGILIFEVLTGDVPFDDHGGDYDRLLTDINSELVIPPDVDGLAADFVRQLLTIDPDNRLGVDGVDQIKGHPWLANIPWAELSEKSVPSPLREWVPKRDSKTEEPDTKHFNLYQLYEKSPDSQSPRINPAVLEELFDGYE